MFDNQSQSGDSLPIDLIKSSDLFDEMNKLYARRLVDKSGYPGLCRDRLKAFDCGERANFYSFWYRRGVRGPGNTGHAVNIED
jgi:hypothetical protein